MDKAWLTDLVQGVGGDLNFDRMLEIYLSTFNRTLAEADFEFFSATGFSDNDFNVITYNAANLYFGTIVVSCGESGANDIDWNILVRDIGDNVSWGLSFPNFESMNRPVVMPPMFLASLRGEAGDNNGQHVRLSFVGVRITLVAL